MPHVTIVLVTALVAAGVVFVMKMYTALVTKASWKISDSNFLPSSTLKPGLNFAAVKVQLFFHINRNKNA